MAPASSYVTRSLSPETWDDFAHLVEANNGVWGGCWCMGFHPEGVGKGHTVSGNRLAKEAHVRNGTVHQILVYDGDECVGHVFRQLAHIDHRALRQTAARDHAALIVEQGDVLRRTVG